MSSEAPFSQHLLLRLDDEEFVRFITSRAQQFAVLGYSDVAKQLISQLNSHKKFRATTLQPLWFLWASLGEWPTGEEEKLKRKIEKQKEQEGKETTITTKDIQDELQRMEDVYAGTWYYTAQTKTAVIKLPDREQVETMKSEEMATAIQDLLNAVLEEINAAHRDASTGSAAMDASAWFTTALDLRCLLRERGYEEKGMISVEEFMDRFSVRMESNEQIVYLTQSRRAWEVMKTGALAKALSVDDKKARNYAKLLEEAVDERIRDGRKRPAPPPMREMLETLDDNTRTNPDSLEFILELNNGGPPDSLFYEPATPEEIRKTEEQLEIELPADYKEFLTITNGLKESWGGIITDAPLHPINEIRWLDDDDEDYFTDLPLDVFDVPVWVDPWPTVGKAIEIGTVDIDHVWLVPPPKVQELKDRISEILKNEDHEEKLKKSFVEKMEEFAGSVEKFMKLEWLLVTWAAGGAAAVEGYPSFTAYIQDKMDGSSRGPDDALRAWKFFGYQCR